MVSTASEKRRLWATIKVTPAASAARTMASADAVSSAIGFSTRMCFPAFAASQTISAWESFGVVTTTAWTPGSRRSCR